MAVNLRGVTTVLLPGTGSDDDYVYRAFSDALHDVGAVVVTPRPQPDRLIDGYLDAFDNAARAAPIAVGGVSIGAAVAAAWALAHPGHVVAVLAALPAWTGAPDAAPAALAARHSAETLRRDGLASATAQMRASSPAWLADELTRSWVGQWPALPDAMDEAACYVAPTCGQLERLAVPMGVAVGHRRSGAPGRGRLRVGGGRTTSGAAHGHARRDGREPGGAGRSVRGRAVRGVLIAISARVRTLSVRYRAEIASRP